MDIFPIGKPAGPGFRTQFSKVPFIRMIIFTKLWSRTINLGGETLRVIERLGVQNYRALRIYISERLVKSFSQVSTGLHDPVILWAHGVHPTLFWEGHEFTRDFLNTG